MQNISFITIIGMLLSCAFFFSQQTRGSLQSAVPAVTPTETFNGMSMQVEDIPDCKDEKTVSNELDCLQGSLEMSSALLDAKLDEILSLEPDSTRRFDFMEMHYTWEDSREADCEYVLEKSGGKSETDLPYLHCMLSHNIQRLDDLDGYFCEWYDTSQCAQ
jgi:uncharacterized protein YecT (DUF1311 family)